MTANTSKPTAQRNSDVAVLLPVYNDQAGLEIALSALENDSYICDVVIVDDASKVPMSIDHIRSKHKLILLRQEKNGKIAGALNAGLDYILRHGYTYVARLDANDIPVNNRINRQRAYLEAIGDCMAVGSHNRFIDAEGRVIYDSPSPVTFEQVRRHNFYNNAIPDGGAMIRASVFQNIGLYSADYPAAEGYEFFYRLLRHYKAENIDEYLSDFAYSSEGVSTKSRRQQLISRLRIQCKMFDIYEPHCYGGLLMTIGSICLPSSLLHKIKKLLGKEII